MKKVLALVIAMILLAAVTPMTLAADATVYVSVSVDGQLDVAAQPVTVTDMTVQGAIKAAHKAYYSGGEDGYAGGIDKTYNMFLITRAWGVTATPYVILNGAPLGSDPANPATADVAPVKAGDNIVISVSSDPAVAAQAIALTATIADGKATVTATSWTLDFTTFAYSSAPLADAAVVDPDTGAALGTTDQSGSVTTDVPAGGVVAVDGLAAINVNAAASSPAVPAPTASAPAAPAAEDTPLFYPPTNSMLIAMAIVLPPIIVVICIKTSKQSRLDKKAAETKK
ncbi:hypothetical protein SAMN02745823_00036 [Sporobacter termitidis DSM 10068]|uniref:Uncharacterized protein n=1 Tax=Sporobacter termitidis DSM 10068 TaxID=1123282 RepID=A0A1M5TCZ5_9FIRM|nr:hypothetical protein [Sporobacter termitidis]SHH48500.1 hypothetical protein SAMN02745823_00036 [Sporobacter termitidis DSM 10068]